MPEKITISANGTLIVPDNPVIPFIEGDGVGRDIWPAARTVIDAAVERAYGGARKIHWKEVLAGEKAERELGQVLPDEVFREMEEHLVAIKGPLTTPVGGGFRSLNVTLRRRLDLYACVRPVRYIAGTPSPVKHPEKLDVVIFRENTEDVYAGIEWPAGSSEAEELAAILAERFKTPLRPKSGIGIKPVSEEGSKRLVRMAIRYALDRGRRSVTLVHKGNIMKWTEGAFREWGYEVAGEFAGSVVPEGKETGGAVVVKDRIADSMFQQILLRPDEYDVIATTNLNGDYLSDAAAAQVGGLGMAPGANIGDRVALFEATHGTAPKHAGKDRVNPSSLILSGVMMLDHLGWREAGAMITDSIRATIASGVVTYDLARQMRDARKVSCSGFAEEIVKNIGE